MRKRMTQIEVASISNTILDLRLVLINAKLSVRNYPRVSA